jgi:hypothetical protein
MLQMSDETINPLKYPIEEALLKKTVRPSNAMEKEDHPASTPSVN